MTDHALMLLGYNTNGFAHHTLADTFAILRDIGYQSVALTVERDLLTPPDRRGVSNAILTLRGLLASHPLRITIESGARFLLDPRRKHQPTLVSRDPQDRARRVEFLLACLELASAVGADSVSLWSGAPDDDAPQSECMNRLLDGLREVLTASERHNVRLAFEPEPGMFIERMADFVELFQELNHPLFGLTLDVGHVHCLNDGDVAAHIEQWRDRLWNVHLEDMRRGRHEHLPFGEGDLDVPRVIRAFKESGYGGPVHVELSRHSHDAVNIARRAFAYVQPLIDHEKSR